MQCPRKCENGIQVPGEDGYRDDHTCTYCGSLSAQVFLEKVRDGCALTPTDKDYKVYINCLGHTHKFYFQHFSSVQQHEFIDMINEKITKFEGGSFFYVLPFFCKLSGEQL